MRVILYYGYHDGKHAFQLADSDCDMSDDSVREAFAKALGSRKDRFDFGSCLIPIPDETENRLLERGTRAAQFTMLNGPWRNDACKGYAIMAMRGAGLDEQTIYKVGVEMTALFDSCTVEEAAKCYMDSFIP